MSTESRLETSIPSYSFNAHFVLVTQHSFHIVLCDKLSTAHAEKEQLSFVRKTKESFLLLSHVNLCIRGR